MPSRAGSPTCLCTARFSLGPTGWCGAICAPGGENVAVAAVRVGRRVDRSIALEVEGELVVGSATSVEILLAAVVVFVVYVAVSVLRALDHRKIASGWVASAALRKVIHVDVPPGPFGAA